MSKPHGEKEFHYRPNHVDGDRFRENYDTIFRKKEPQSDLTEFEVWSEGYSCTGQSSGAILHGRFVAKTFKSACALAFRGLVNYDPKQMTYWGCKLFDNEADARKTFG